MAGTITHEWNGTTLIITSDSGTSSCDLKGQTGDIGIRGPQGIPGISVVAEESYRKDETYSQEEVNNLLLQKVDTTAYNQKIAKLESDISILTDGEDITAMALSLQNLESVVPQLEEDVAAKANVSDVPTKTSQLENDSGFITEYPSLDNYVTKNELEAKDSNCAKLNIANNFGVSQLYSGTMPSPTTATENTTTIGKNVYVFGGKNTSGGWAHYSLVTPGQLNMIGDTNNAININAKGTNPTLTVKDATNGSRSFTFGTTGGKLATQEWVAANGGSLYKHHITFTTESLKNLGHAGTFDIISSRATAFTTIDQVAWVLYKEGSTLPYMAIDGGGVLCVYIGGAIFEKDSGGYEGYPELRIQGCHYNAATSQMEYLDECLDFNSFNLWGSAIYDAVTAL